MGGKFLALPEHDNILEFLKYYKRRMTHEKVS
jgi:hypothetical protein